MITVDDMSIDTTTPMEFFQTSYDPIELNFTTMDIFYESLNSGLDDDPSLIKSGKYGNKTFENIHDYLNRRMMEIYCSNQYCSGHIKDVVMNYNKVHGYISLLVIEYI